MSNTSKFTATGKCASIEYRITQMFPDCKIINNYPVFAIKIPCRLRGLFLMNVNLPEHTFATSIMVSKNEMTITCVVNGADFMARYGNEENLPSAL